MLVLRLSQPSLAGVEAGAELGKRGHRTCDQSYKINTIIPAITTLYTNMFI